MVASRRVSMAVVAVLGVIAVAGRAHAQTPEAPPVFPVEIGGADNVASIQLQGPGEAIDCGTHCTVGLPHGRYLLTVRDTRDRVSTQWVSVAAPRRFTVRPANRGARIGGIVVMGTGFAITAGGGFVLLATVLGHAMADCFSDCSRDWPRGQLYGGFIAVAAGAAVGVTGLVIWRSNVHAVVDEASASSTPQLRLTPTAAPHVAGLGLTGSF